MHDIAPYIPAYVMCASHVQDLATDHDKERQQMLLERMMACAHNLRCEMELSSGKHKWVLTYKTW